MNKYSFGQWLIDTYGEDALDKYWSKKNTLNPFEIYCKSDKKVWILCQNKEYHNDDGGYLTMCRHFYNGSRCPYCSSHKVHMKDSLGNLRKDIALGIAIKENNITFRDTYNLSLHNDKLFYFKCPNCGKVSKNKITIDHLTTRGYSCKYCNDGFPMTEKFMMNLLDSLNIKYIIQLSKTTFSWCGKYKYDFYLPNYNVIIECHGGQHYKESTRGRNLKDEQQNDIDKMKLAQQHVNQYIIINMSKSNFNWFKKNCIESLNDILDLSNVNWELIWEKSQNSLVIKSWNLWNEGLHNTKEISDKLGISKRTVLKYMKLGVECGKCNYTKEESYNACRRKGYR